MTLAEHSNYLNGELSHLFTERELNQHLTILYDHYLGLSRTSQLLAKDRLLTDEELDQLEKAKTELLQQKPIDYIIQQSIFFGYEFFVDERVLIPRSETEELVQWILENETAADLEILDIGSGSGCIPIILSLEGNFATVDACEISETAIEVSEANTKALGAHVTYALLDILKETPTKKYDIVVSNPPYVKQEELGSLDKNVVEYEPKIALAPEGSDPLIFYKRMIEIAHQMLKKGGRMYWEIHEDLGNEVIELLRATSFKNIELKQDIYGRDRMVKCVYL